VPRKPTSEERSAEQQTRKLVETLGEWAMAHPDPDAPLLYASGTEVTPKSILKALRRPESQAGEVVGHLISAGLGVLPGEEAAPITVDDAIEHLKHDTEEWEKDK
jgi:hypothetical protein